MAADTKHDKYDVDVGIKEGHDAPESADASDKVETSSYDEVLRAAGIGIQEDNPTEPVLTLRMWLMGIGFCIVCSGLNTLYTLRNPSITISSSVVLLLAYPLGKFWEKFIPSWNVSFWFWSFNLNPGPFNQKEHVLVYIMSNLSIYVRLGADVLTEQQMFFGYEAGWGFQMLITFATFMIGFCLAGLFRSVIVEPPDLVWPGVLSTTSLTTTLHHIGQGDVQGLNTRWKLSRYGFFSIAFCISFCWYWFPDFIFPATSYFTFPCWINPKSTVVNQIFGMKSGMGLLPLTFDWSQISYVGSPLLIPSWAIVNVFVSLAFWIWIVSSACYYMNVWYSGYLPFQSSSVFDNKGSKYKANKVVNKATGYTLSMEKYKAYSPVYVPIVYAINSLGLSFATLSALLMWVFLEKRHVIATGVRRLPQIFTAAFTRNHEKSDENENQVDVPPWWYVIAVAVALFCSIFAVEYWDVELRWYGVLLALAVALVFYFPLALVYATSSLKIKIDILCRIIAGVVFKGKVLANIWFFDIGYITTIKGLWFAEDMKLGHYCNIPPRKVFLVQVVGMIAGTLSSICTLNWSLYHITGVCTSDAPNGFSCPYSRTHFNTSMIWGAVGPKEFFLNGIGYSALLYFFLIGAILPVIVHFFQKRYPGSLWRRVHVPLFLGGLNYLPPATGTSYGSWALVGLGIGWFLRKYISPGWWYKYNFVLSSAMDSSVSIAGVVIFFTIFYTGASDGLKWWGTQVYKETCDWKKCSHLSVPEGGKFGI